ncbi:hypothetical protein C8Q80DRAFT_1273483 [Daedaleopsis nitida]|nr:hypothetical protein C8Q80DRAFT_1273483 [Daedaleopsis nitida]
MGSREEDRSGLGTGTGTGLGSLSRAILVWAFDLGTLNVRTLYFGGIPDPQAARDQGRSVQQRAAYALPRFAFSSVNWIEKKEEKEKEEKEEEKEDEDEEMRARQPVITQRSALSTESVRSDEPVCVGSWVDGGAHGHAELDRSPSASASGKDGQAARTGSPYARLLPLESFARPGRRLERLGKHEDGIFLHGGSQLPERARRHALGHRRGFCHFCRHAYPLPGEPSRSGRGVASWSRSSQLGG